MSKATIYQHILDEIARKGTTPLDIEKSKALMNIIESGSLSAAAENLGYTTSGISRMISTLEQECGFPLLIRGRNGASPTEECIKLIPYITKLLEAEENCRQEIDAITGMETGQVRVGSAYAAYYNWLSTIIGEFGKKYPKISVSITEGTSSELIEMIEERQMDFAIISKRQGLANWVPLRKDRLAAWVPKGHPAAKAGKLALDTLAREPFIELFPGKETDNAIFLRENKIKVNAQYSAGDTYAAYSMVEANLGITLINEMFSEVWKGDGVVTVPLEPPQQIEIGIALPAHNDASPALKRFAEFARARLPQI